MFEKVEVPVLGIVENMSLHICSKCGNEESIFGEGGGSSLAEESKVDLLGKLPLDKSIREQCAHGLLWQNGEHLYVWYESELIETLKELGFIMVKKHKYQESRMLDFTNIDTQGKIRALHSAVVEAQKPWS